FGIDDKGGQQVLRLISSGPDSDNAAQRANGPSPRVSFRSVGVLDALACRRQFARAHAHAGIPPRSRSSSRVVGAGCPVSNTYLATDSRGIAWRGTRSASLCPLSCDRAGASSPLVGSAVRRPFHSI